MGVDAGRDAVCQSRVVPQETAECGAIERPTVKGQGGGEEALVALEHIEADGERIPRGGVAELIVESRGEKW